MTVPIPKCYTRSSVIWTWKCDCPPILPAREEIPRQDHLLSSLCPQWHRWHWNDFACPERYLVNACWAEVFIIKRNRVVAIKSWLGHVQPIQLLSWVHPLEQCLSGLLEWGVPSRLWKLPLGASGEWEAYELGSQKTCAGLLWCVTWVQAEAGAVSVPPWLSFWKSTPAT